MEMMLISFLLPEVKREFNSSAVSESMVGTATFLGMALGAYGWGMLSDKIGRRKVYLAVSLWTAVCGVASAASTNITHVAIARGFVGFGLGGAPVSFSLFTEYCPTAKRGIYLSIVQGKHRTPQALQAVLNLLGIRYTSQFTFVKLRLTAISQVCFGAPAPWWNLSWLGLCCRLLGGVHC
jgi:MFS family permease